MCVQLKPFRNRGRTCRRVLALTAEEEQFILEFATFKDSYEERIAGIIHSNRSLIRGDLIILESPCFRDDLIRPFNSNILYREMEVIWETTKGYFDIFPA